MERTFNIGDLFQVREIIVECTGVIHDNEFVFGIPCNTDGEIKEMKFLFSEVTEQWEKKKELLSIPELLNHFNETNKP